MENLTVVSTILYFQLQAIVLSILFSNGKSNRCFNKFLAFSCRQSIRRFNSFLKWKIELFFGQFFGLECNNLAVVSILLSNGKSNRCFKTFLALHCRQSTRCFNSFLKWKISTLFKYSFLPSIAGNLSVVSILFSNGKSNRCFNKFLAFSCSSPADKCQIGGESCTS